jgi:hypothetical protein
LKFCFLNYLKVNDNYGANIMGLKDKAKGIWKRVSDLDDGSESVNSLSKEKERIPYKDISKKLKEVMKSNVDVVGRKIIIPNYYAIYFNKADRKMREEVEDVVCDELKEELYHDMRKINPEQNKRDLCIEVKTDATIENSEFRIGFHIKKAEPGEKIIEEETPVQEPNVENEIDYKETVIEQTPSTIADDKQTVIMQRPTDEILYKLLVDSGEEKQEIEVTKKTITIGRGSKDDVCLLSPDFSISRSHAKITLKDDEYYLTPFGINGTLLNGQELELNEESKISAGDEIKIMNYSIKILM